MTKISVCDKTLVIMRGVSGSGKSTFINNHFPQAVICSADFYHMDKNGNYNWKPGNIGKAHQECQFSCELAMINDEPLIVIDNTNTRHREMKPYLTMAEDYEYNVSVIRLEVPLELLYGRNLHNVPDQSVKAMYDRMEPWEGEEVIVPPVS